MKLKPKTIAVLIAGMFTVSAVTIAQAQTTPPATSDKKDEKKTTELGTVSVTGEGDKLGAGTIIQEEGTKARSTAARASIDKQRSTANPFQLISLLPGVNTSSQDATGLFGGSLRVRGFNSDQMGFTVDGAPVNDSGNFAVFPQEYVDAENLEEVFVTQGSADNEAPHVGATGGNIGIVSSNPLDKFRFRFQVTGGQLSLNKTFFRVDTGLLGNFKAFLSYSDATVNKWKGTGKADRQHIDFKAAYNLGKGSSLQFTALWNDATNNNIRSLSRANIAAGGTRLDYATVWIPDPAAVAGTAQTTPTRVDGYWTIPVNPFKNAVVTAKGWFAITPQLRADIEPYFWYGFGNGNGPAPTVVTLREGTGTTALGGGLRDINGDGDRLDTVSVFRSSVTQTFRPGVTVKLNYQWNNHRIVGGYWFERARHRQTQPAIKLNTDGSVANYFLDDESLWVRRVDGSAYQGREQRTISTASSFFLQDTISLMNDKLILTPSIKVPTIERDFTNFANDSGGASALTYNRTKTERNANPSIGARYSISDAHQVFGSVTRGSRTTNNFNLAASALVNGVLLFPDVKPETSTTLDFGYRHLSDAFTFSGTLFATDFKNRISRAYDEVAARTVDTNVGDASIRGFELEAGTRPWNGVSMYGSLTYTKTELKNDVFGQGTPTALLTQRLPTSGKEFPDTPRWLAGFTVQYANGPFLANLSSKYTGRRYASLVNDEAVSGFVTSDLNMAYRFGATSWMKNATLRLNVSNLFDRDSLLLSTGSGSSFVNNTLPIPGVTSTTSTVFYYVGAPRFTSLSLQFDF
jgi:iron complex outermembrane receptor protein